MRNRYLKAAVALAAISVGANYWKSKKNISEDQSIVFSLQPEDAVAVLSAEDEAHLVSFQFPSKNKSQLIMATAEPTIICKDNTISNTHKIIDGLLKEVTKEQCIQTSLQIASMGPVKVLEREAQSVKDMTMRNHQSLTTSRAILQGKVPPVPVLQIVDYKTVAQQPETVWDGTVEEIQKSMKLAVKNESRARIACEQLIKACKVKETIEKCTKRATVAAKKFEQSMNGLIKNARQEENRGVTTSSCIPVILFSPPTKPKVSALDATKNEMLAAYSRRL